jgi:hypothetical protein
MTDIPGTTTQDLIDALAHESVSRELIRALARREAASAAPATPSVDELWRYARRPPRAPADLRIEAALRSDARTAARYRQLMRGAAIAHSPLAMAAATGAFPERKVGDFRLRVVEDPDATYLVLSADHAGVTPPSSIEAHGDGRLVRIELSPAVRGHITIMLERAKSDHSVLIDLLRDPGCELFLM